MSAPPLAQLRGVHFHYPTAAGPVHALRGIDLDIHRGEFIAITGASGSGKSTLLNVLGCLDPPTAGVYTLDGQPTGDDDDTLAALRARAVGFVFQTFRLLPQHDVLGNVMLPFLYREMAEEEAAARAREAIAAVGLAHRAHHRPGALSGGEMQRVAIARALVTRPLLLLADEPTGNLDQQTGDTILDLFARLYSEGATIVLVTHDPRIAARAPRRLHMADGCLAEAAP